MAQHAETTAYTPSTKAWVRYISTPFTLEPNWAEASKNLDLAA